jgi:hypothetical protein
MRTRSPSSSSTSSELQDLSGGAPLPEPPEGVSPAPLILTAAQETRHNAFPSHVLTTFASFAVVCEAQSALYTAIPKLLNGSTGSQIQSSIDNLGQAVSNAVRRSSGTYKQLVPFSSVLLAACDLWYLLVSAQEGDRQVILSCLAHIYRALESGRFKPVASDAS